MRLRKQSKRSKGFHLIKRLKNTDVYVNCFNKRIYPKGPERAHLVFRLRNDLYCVEWGVKLYSLTPPRFLTEGRRSMTKSELAFVYCANYVQLFRFIELY